MKEDIENWKKTTNLILEKFIIKYFDLFIGDLHKGDYFWVGDEIGGICNYGDYFFNFSDVLICIENDISPNTFFEWYDWCLENQSEYINLKSFILGASEVKEIERRQIEKLRLKVIEAEQHLKEAIENFKKK